jgi:hypothetical protein
VEVEVEVEVEAECRGRQVEPECGGSERARRQERASSRGPQAAAVCIQLERTAATRASACN